MRAQSLSHLRMADAGRDRCFHLTRCDVVSAGGWWVALMVTSGCAARVCKYLKSKNGMIY